MLTPIQKAILTKRGIKDEDMEAFVAAKVDNLHNPLLLTGVKAAAGIIEAAIRNEQRICIVGDFDADGITATALMLLALQELGANNVCWYINNRFEFGYGLQVASLQDIVSKHGHVDVLITVDNGITAVEAIAEAKALGLTVIVTDHHEPQAIIPEADVIINPKLPGCTYPEKNLAGVGVAFKLIQHLFEQQGISRRALLYLDLVAIGTVADVMSLTGENRIIVKNGLTLMNWEKARIGVKSLKRTFNVKDVVSTYHLGFCFGPALNAQGRIDGVPAEAIELLTTKQPERADLCAQRLYSLNKERQELTECQVKQALGNIGQQPPKFIVYYDENIHEGIAGLIAGRVKEHFRLPTLILTKDDKHPGLAKGSARSIDGFNMKEHLLDQCGDLLVRGGGHAMAAGITLKIEDIPLLASRLITMIEQYPEQLFVAQVDIDYTFEAQEISLELVGQIAQLAPFGVGFPTPIFKVNNFAVKNAICFGKDEKHLKFVGERGMEIVLFGQGKSFTNPKNIKTIHALGSLVKNEWNGFIKIQFMAKEGSEVCC